LDEPKYSIEQIAARVGKQPSFVASRMKLIDLCPQRSKPSTQRDRRRSRSLAAKLPADEQQQALSACFKEVYSGGQNPARFSCLCAICNSD